MRNSESGNGSGITSVNSRQFEAILEKDGLKVSRSPWGADDEIGRLNWVTPASTAAVLSRIRPDKIFDLAVDYFIGMPSWTMSGDPKYEIWQTHTPQGSVLDGLTGSDAEIHQRYSLSADAVLMNTHCGTHMDTLMHVGHCGVFWNGITPEEALGGRYWLRGGADSYPPIIARGVLLDVAATHQVDCLPTGYAITAEDLRTTAKRQDVKLQPGDVVLVRTGMMSKWPNTEYLEAPAGLGMGGAQYLCDETGAMCIGTDTLAFEVFPSEQPDTYLPVHGYMLATAGAPIFEVVRTDDLARAHIYEFAFIGAPLKLRGSTGAPVRPIAVPLAD